MPIIHVHCPITNVIYATLNAFTFLSLGGRRKIKKVNLDMDMSVALIFFWKAPLRQYCFMFTF